MSILYTDNDAFVCAWARNLVAAGLVPKGDVVCADIRELKISDVRGYRQAHFFCGILGWPLALRLAGWPDDREVWTGSCPCQPFSSASRGRAKADLDLWPELYRLIVERRPAVIFGEQVDEARAWLDGVCDDMEAVDYAVWARVLPAYCVEKDHVRERLYFASYPNRQGKPGRSKHAEMAGLPRGWCDATGLLSAHGVPGDVAVKRSLGNAIVPQVAAEFIQAFAECRP